MSSASVAPLGKHLASSDKKVRDKAVKGLTAYICDDRNANLPPLEMAKLWKALFYCFWMSDKPLVQQALATDLSNILLAIPTLEASLKFLRGFWESLVREWAGLDRYRIDKYLMLVRKWVHATFLLLLRSGWDQDAIKTVNDIYACEAGPLRANNLKTPQSLQSQIADVFLPELDKALGSSETDDEKAPLILLLEPILELASNSTSKVISQRLESVVLRPAVSAFTDISRGSGGEEDEEPSRKRARTESEPRALSNIRSRTTVSHSTTADDPDDSSSDGESKAVLQELLSTLLAAAGKDSVPESNRKRIYALCRAARED